MEIGNDDFNAYRAMCANRLRRLERYKKARSFCNIDDEGTSEAKTPDFPSSAPPYCDDTTTTKADHFFAASSRNGPAAFEMIREKMLSLMENDMTLLQQLLTLGDQITEMKKMKEQSLRKCQSHTSLDDDDDSEDQFEDGFSASMSAVTTFCVGENQPQYFSRQNSVLRIPIPPRSSNRFGHKRILRRPSELIRTAPNFFHEPPAEVPEVPSGNVPLSHIVPPPVIETGVGNIDRSTLDPSNYIIKNRSSNSSIDSGIRESSPSSSPSPTPYEKEVI
ncbi:unnamed protein product [Cylicocyclus nassatus]|uniref:Uncharacterized protein n=1 Tax=Cylicocyclus nassatus TaxID=53992 RepID=A0AA36MCS0_CYLNA|nr:unnamed protein product [Cylicocyclus nassatus]